MERVYICGRISSLPRKEYMEQFALAESILRRCGYTPVNPTRYMPQCLYKIVGYKLTLLFDLWLLSRCDYIIKLPCWRQSRGANIESCWAFHFKVWPLPLRWREIIVNEVTKLIKHQADGLQGTETQG